jgi:hypothetical protein
MIDSPEQPDAVTRDAHAGDRTTAAYEAPAAVSPSTLPERVGRYILGQLIDGGGMGRVFKAVHEETRAEAAIKIMRTDLAGPDAAERFRQEGRLLAKMRHPNIAQVYDAGTTRVGGVDTPYIAMEFIPGARTVRDFAAGQSTDDLLRTFIKVCRAVHHANERGIVHRDLKPSNILVDAYGEPKVIDFGVAKNLDGHFDESAVVTLEGGVPGTVPYMAPEQVSWRHELIDRRTDVYALGVVLYELICGRLPYRVNGVALPEAVRVICEEEPTEPTRMTTRELLGRDLRTVLMKMLAKSRQRRYQSAEDVACELERVLAGRDIEASPASVVYRMRRWLGVQGDRERLAAAAAIWVGAVALTMLLGPRLLYRGTALAASYAGLVMSFADTPGVGYNHVRVIGVDDVEAVAAALPGVDLGAVETDPAPATRVRPVIGAMLERLALCDPRCVAVDFRFNAPDRAEFIVAGIAALHEHGVETVVGSTSFVPRGYGTGGATGLGDFDESIARVARWGSVSAGEARGSLAVGLALRVRRTGDVFPSFGLATLVAAAAYDQDFVTSIEDGTLRVSYLDVGGRGRQARRRGEGLDVAYTEVGAHPRSDPARGITAGDLVANAAVGIPPWALAESGPSTLALGEALAMPIEDLRRLVAGRVVMIADLRPGLDEIEVGGKRLHKGYLWATWLDRELDGRSVRGPGMGGAAEQIYLGGLLGASLLFVPVGRRRWVASAATVVGALAALAAGVLVFEFWSIMFVPLLGVAALCVAGAAVVCMPRPVEL